MEALRALSAEETAGAVDAERTPLTAVSASVTAPTTTTVLAYPGGGKPSPSVRDLNGHAHNGKPVAMISGDSLLQQVLF